MKVFFFRGKSILFLSLLFGSLCTAGFLWSQKQLAPVSTSSRSLPIYCVDTTEKVVSLGINCAWSNTDIDQILKTLSDNNVKATFFILGEWCKKYPDSVKSIAAAGHEIASHGYSHRNMTSLDSGEITLEVAKSMDILEKTSNKKPTLLRPPSGDYNNRVIDTIRALGYFPIQWDVDTLDWKGLTCDEMLLRVSAKTREGSILLLHSGAEHSAKALPEIIHSLKESGFSFKPVGELIYQTDYSIDVEGRQHQNK